MKRLILLTLLSLFILDCVKSQTWARLFNTSPPTINGRLGITYSSIQANDNSIITVGHEQRVLSGIPPLMIQKYKPDGIFIWEKIYPEFINSFWVGLDSMTINKGLPKK